MDQDEEQLKQPPSNATSVVIKGSHNPVYYRIIDWFVGTVLFNRMAIVLEGTWARAAGRSGGMEMLFQTSMLLALLFGGVGLIYIIDTAYTSPKRNGALIRGMAYLLTFVLYQVSLSMI